MAILLFLALWSTTTSLAQAPPFFVGNWTLDYTTTLGTAQTMDSATFSTVSPEILNQLQFLYQGRRYNIMQNGSFTMINQDNTVVSGIWSFSETSNQLQLTDTASGQQLTFTPNTDGPNLILNMQGRMAVTALLKNLYLIPTP